MQCGRSLHRLFISLGIYTSWSSSSSRSSHSFQGSWVTVRRNEKAGKTHTIEERESGMKEKKRMKTKGNVLGYLHYPNLLLIILLVADDRRGNTILWQLTYDVSKGKCNGSKMKPTGIKGKMGTKHSWIRLRGCRRRQNEKRWNRRPLGRWNGYFLCVYLSLSFLSTISKMHRSA